MNTSIDVDCCPKQCLYDFRPSDILKMRKNIWELSPAARHSKFRSLFEHSLKKNNKWKFFFNRKKLCSSAIKQLYGLSKYLFKKYAASSIKGTVSIHGNTGRKYSQEETDAMINWINQFVHDFGEPQPDSSFINLPSYLNKAQLYTEALEEIKVQNPDYTISISQFYNIWSTSFKHVKIPVHTRLGRCDDCSNIQKELKNIQSEEGKNEWKRRKQQHLQLVREERRFLSERKLLAKTNKETYHHLIIDGMTMIYMPNIQPIPKGICCIFFKIDIKGSTQELRMKFHMTGIIDHSYGKRRLFITPETIAGGANLTCSVLWNHLSMILNPNESHTPHLQIQFDNCFRENKNLIMFGFASLLVHHNIYKTVTLSCLIQGHTHEDIDQMFSTWSRYYWTHTLETFNEIQSFINSAYPTVETRPSVHFMSSIWNWKDLIKQNLNNISHHSGPR